MAKRRKIEHHTIEYHAWEKLSNTSKELHECAKMIDNYKKVLIQISQLTKRHELETTCKPEEKWSLEYVWNVSSAEHIKEFVMMYLESLKNRYDDLKKMTCMENKTDKQISDLNNLTYNFAKEINRWKRIIRYIWEDENMEEIEKKTFDWVCKFVKRWDETEKKYEHLDKKFFSMYHAFKITSVDKSK